ncbi:MAG: TonB-dependent receptor [Gammaproteobacteria bacterium]|nr:TonB-dependent receptor [Gammaproteobacteria bacterium]MBU0788086.1 TonB-dependent receptor [Gammaproteobacteria bacterium]MBU0815416.1 TonB-dependent receptor [Gammaproteobacteria bacterium]MBU1785476.1 TonB-dependent receptor [Gammaproteobacteria bacterium]
MAFPLAVVAQSLPTDEAPVKTLGIVSVSSGQPSSLPTQIPTTIEGVTREQIEATVNATDSEDALKYLPSLLVRKRYIGDYNHAVLSSRASGTGNSARSAVYADGILLSNYLGNGATYAPRWGMVTPEEIERVDVMYGPFSAAYPGNSAGAVVDYVTRMPKQFEAHIKSSVFTQPFELYNSSETYSGNQSSASMGSRSGDWSWWVNVNHTDSAGQAQTFATKAQSATTGVAGTAVSGAVAGLDRTNTPWYILGTNTQYHTQQDHAKLKLAYEVTSTLRASYTLGYWDNTSDGNPQTYLRDAAGNPVYATASNVVNINGQNYNISGLFNASRERLTHVMHGLSLKTHTQGEWDWELAASQYGYSTDLQRNATLSTTVGLTGGAGTITDQNGTGWRTLAAKATWRPQGLQGAHIVDMGVQQENYALRILKSNIAGNWLSDPAGSLNSDVGGLTQMQSLYGQDSWAFAPNWKTVLGARVENWQAKGGFTRTASSARDYADRNETHVSPKAALAYQYTADTVLKLSTGRAVRMPTVQELYGATSGVLTVVNDPLLKPEKSWTTELSAEKDLGNALLRATLFYEASRDALYSQSSVEGGSVVTRIQNVGAIHTSGLELAFQGADVLKKGLDVSGSLTYADSRIVENSGYVVTPGDTIGQYQPRVPLWRATALLSYRHDAQWTTSLGARYSGDQYSTLNNADVNGFAYMGASRYFTTDLRVRYRIDRQWTAAFGIDNLNNYQYWNFHPYPQRSYMAELKLDI